MLARPISFIALVILLTSVSALASASPSAETVIREYTAAWNRGDIDAFLALHSPDVKKYRRMPSSSEFTLGTSGREEVRKKYEPLFAKTPRVHVEIVSVSALGDLVVSRDSVSGFPDGHIAHELTLYEVRNGLIHNIWYLERLNVAAAEKSGPQ